MDLWVGGRRTDRQGREGIRKGSTQLRVDDDGEDGGGGGDEEDSISK